MSDKIEIKKLVLDIEGKEISLSLDKAEKLYEALKEMFDKKIVFQPSNPIVIDRYRPWYWDHYTYSCSSDTKLEFKSDSSALTMQIK